MCIRDRDQDLVVLEVVVSEEEDLHDQVHVSLEIVENVEAIVSEEEVVFRQIVVKERVIIIQEKKEDHLEVKEDSQVIQTSEVKEDQMIVEVVNSVSNLVFQDLKDEKEDFHQIVVLDPDQIVVTVSKVEEVIVVLDQVVDLKDLLQRKLWKILSQVVNQKEEAIGEESKRV